MIETKIYRAWGERQHPDGYPPIQMKEVTVLVDEIEQLQARVKELEATNLGLTKTLVELEAENAELRKDAERYRWVRSQASPIQVFIYGVDEGLAVDALDEALDRDLYGEADNEGET